MSEIKTGVMKDLAWGVGIVVLALSATWARQQGWIDGDTVTRLVMGATGLMLAAFGNRAPKRLAPSACAARVARVSGWSLAISGLIYAGQWALAPFEVALWGGCAAVLIGMVVTFGYCFSVARRARADRA